MKRLIFILYLVNLLFNTLPGQAQQPAQREITIEVTNRQLNGSVYTADLIIVVRPNLSWRVDECSFYLGFNVAALNQTSYIGQSLLNLDPGLSVDYSAYQSVVIRGGNVVPGIVRVELEHILGRPYTVKSADSRNLIIRIGTIRWNATGNDALDGIHLITDRTTPFLPKVQYYDPALKMTFVYTENQIHIPGSPSIPVNRGGCTNSFFAPPQTCNTSYAPLSTINPIADNCPRWPQKVGPGVQPAVARFQYDFNPAFTPTGWQAQDFNYNEIAPALDAARCRWEKQIDSPNLNMFDWEPTTAGGRFYFTTVPEDLSINPLGVFGLAAITYLARDPTGLSTFKDTSQCGPTRGAENFKRRSEIIFNNCAAFHAANPHRHWTTKTGSCTNDFCYDFFSIAEHELGHYIGLDHELRNPDATMFVETIWAPPLSLTQCDADNARRLYNPSRVAAPPDNTSCSIPTDVKTESSLKITENALSVYPSPNYGDICTVKYTLNKETLIRLSVTDLLGNQVIPAIEKQREAGIYQSAFSTETLQSGAYLVILHINGEQLTQKFVLIR